jgi:hydroxyacylglutathione hydrolase
VCIQDSRSGHVFSGDTFGLSYREFDDGDRQFVIPTSSPVHFDPAAAHRSVDLIAGLKPGAVYVTHYSRVWEINRLADDMHRLIDAYVDLAQRCGGPHPDRHTRLKQGMTDIVLGEAKRYGWKPDAPSIIDVLGGDIDLNAQGLAIWYDGRTAG